MTWNPDMSAAPRDGTVTPEQLIAFGYAPGHYQGPCRDCGTMMYDVDKRAWRCKSCATKLALNPPPTGHPMTQTEQELDGLVKRLRAVWTRFEGRRHGHINPDGPEAIVAIQSLRAELSSAKATIERLERRVLPESLTSELYEELEHLIHNAHYQDELYSPEDFYNKLRAGIERHFKQEPRT